MVNVSFDKVLKVIRSILLRKVRKKPKCFLTIRNLKLGRVQVTESKSKWDPPVYVRHLERGESFGEAALQSYVCFSK